MNLANPVLCVVCGTDIVDLLWISAEVKRGSVVPTRGEKYNLGHDL